MVDDTLEPRLKAIASAGEFENGLMTQFGQWIRNAPDEALFRVNVLAWAQRHGIEERLALDLFLHAASAGVFDISWGVICPNCAILITALGGLKTINTTTFCRLCQQGFQSSLDDNIEVSFSIAPSIRRLRFHDETRLSLRHDADILFFSPSTRQTQLRKWLTDSVIADATLEPRATRIIEFTSAPGEFAAFSPNIHALTYFKVNPDGPTRVSLDLLDGGFIPTEGELGLGPITLTVRNLTNLLLPVGVLYFTEPVPEHIVDLDPFLTGKQLLTSQTFRRLFRTETVGGQSGLQLKTLTVLFTDLKASTALYERVGDLQALDLVRRHFDAVDEIIARERGAIVKTIGDAVMAVFAEPERALRAAVRMEQAVASLPGSELELKIGLHTGPCIAVQSNHQLDYFGRTVNIAARVQSIAGPREIVCTEALWRHPGIAPLVAGWNANLSRDVVRLKGIEEAVEVVRLRSASSPALSKDDM
jgi:class 3 adenylate cyclase